MTRNGFDRPSGVCEVEFVIREGPYPFVQLTDAVDCTFELAELIPRADDKFAEFFNVTGDRPDRVAEGVAANAYVDVTLLAEYEHGHLYEFLVADHCPARRLAELGALPQTVRGDDGTGRIVAEIPESADAPDVVGTFLDEYSEAELASKREKDVLEPLASRPEIRQVVARALTERQREVLETAFENGYYHWPREATGEDVADELGISSATFAEHIRAAEHNLFAVFVGGPEAE